MRGVSRTTNDHKLAHQASQGDKAAFHTLWNRHQSLLRTMARQLVRDQANASDLVQETCLRAYLGMRRLRNPNLLRSWLIGILINVWREWARSKENAQYSRDSLGETDGGSRFFRPVHDREASEDPALLFQNKELRRVIRESVLGLPAKLRMPALMFYFDGMSVRESAAALGVSEDALKMRLSRARARLRSHLA